jgi:hypothetical protein
MIVAVNCALFRLYHEGNMDDERESLSILGMTNILAFGLYLNPRGSRRPFFVGFEVAGLSAVIASLGSCWLFPETTEELFFMLVYPITPLTLFPFLTCLPAGVRVDEFGNRPLYLEIFIFVVFCPIITFPIVLAQLLFGLTGGLVFRQVAKVRTKE